MKALLFANTDWYLYNFRMDLAKELRRHGVAIVFASPHGPYVSKLTEQGFRWVPVPMRRLSLNPFREIRVVWCLIKLYSKERPDVVHHFTIKSVVYGSIAALVTGVHDRINAVAGLGHVFSSTAVRARFLRPIVYWAMRAALSGAHSRLVVQNTDDFDMFVRRGMLPIRRIRLIKSSGVDTEIFVPRKPSVGGTSPTVRVLFAARLIWEKGVLEFVEAAEQLKSEGIDAQFLLAGAGDPGNPSSVTPHVIEQWRNRGAVIIEGHIHDMATYLQGIDIAVLPTFYGEGVPKGLVEAAACGLPIVATDVPGCREVVEHGVNGLMVPARDVKALALAIRALIEDPNLRAKMGSAGRTKALTEFAKELVIGRTLDVYRELVPDLVAA